MDHNVKIVFTASHTPGGKIIRWLTKSDKSHVFAQYTSSLWGGEWAAEAMVKGVVKRPAEKARHHVVKEYQCLFDPKPGFHAIRRYFGESFAFEGVLIAGWLILVWRLFKKKVKSPIHSVKSQFCSELIARFFDASPELPKPMTNKHKGKWNFDIVSPEDIDEFCAADLKHFR